MTEEDADMFDFIQGQKVISKKPHPCGNSEWTVSRVGADIKFTCAACGRTVMMPRSKAEKFVKKAAE